MQRFLFRPCSRWKFGIAAKNPAIRQYLQLPAARLVPLIETMKIFAITRQITAWRFPQLMTAHYASLVESAKIFAVVPILPKILPPLAGRRAVCLNLLALLLASPLGDTLPEFTDFLLSIHRSYPMIKKTPPSLAGQPVQSPPSRFRFRRNGKINHDHGRPRQNNGGGFRRGFHRQGESQDNRRRSGRQRTNHPPESGGDFADNSANEIQRFHGKSSPSFPPFRRSMDAAK